MIPLLAIIIFMMNFFSSLRTREGRMEPFVSLSTCKFLPRFLFVSFDDETTDKNGCFHPACANSPYKIRRPISADTFPNHESRTTNSRNGLYRGSPR